MHRRKVGGLQSGGAHVAAVVTVAISQLVVAGGRPTCCATRLRMAAASLSERRSGSFFPDYLSRSPFSDAARVDSRAACKRAGFKPRSAAYATIHPGVTCARYNIYIYIYIYYNAYLIYVAPQTFD